MTSVRVSTGEAAGLAEILGVPALPGLNTVTNGAPSTDVGELVDRGFVTVEESEFRICEPLSTVLKPLVEADALVSVSRAPRAAVPENRVWLVGPGAAVEVREAGRDAVELEDIEVRAMRPRLFEFTFLDERPRPAGTRFTAPSAELHAATLSGSVAGAAGLTAAAEPFVEALENVTAIFTLDGVVREGDEQRCARIVWFDCGAGGLWLLTPEGQDDVSIEPTNRAAILDRLAGLLRLDETGT